MLIDEMLASDLPVYDRRKRAKAREHSCRVSFLILRLFFLIKAFF